MRLAARDGVEVLDAVGQALFRPRPPAVPRAEDLPAAADAIDLLGVAPVQGHRHHRALGLDAMVEACPALAEILAAVERAVLASRGRAQAGVQVARIRRRDEDVAAVRQRREATDLHAPPARSA